MTITVAPIIIKSREDMYLRMMVGNRNRWSTLDNYYTMDSYYNPHMYYSNPWSYNYSPWSYMSFNNYYSWNSFYNPYCGNMVILNPVKNVTYYNKIKSFNLNAYNNNAYSNSNAPKNGFKNFNSAGINPAYGIPYGTPKYSNSNSSQRPLGSNGKTYSNSDSKSYDYNSSNRPVRSYTPTQSQSVDLRPTRIPAAAVVEAVVVVAVAEAAAVEVAQEEDNMILTYVKEEMQFENA